jgi:DNA gyrase inhibitor GyrI
MPGTRRLIAAAGETRNKHAKTVAALPPRFAIIPSPLEVYGIMSTTEVLEIVTWPETHYVYVEKVGPFMQNAHQAWQELHALAPSLANRAQITGAFAMYKMGPQIYRAGFRIAAAPLEVPAGLTYLKFEGGKFARYVVKGSYAQLPQESGRAWSEFGKSGLPARDAFALENYANDPSTTPEAELITEILIPTA